MGNDDFRAKLAIEHAAHEFLRTLLRPMTKWRDGHALNLSVIEIGDNVRGALAGLAVAGFTAHMRHQIGSPDVAL